MAGRAEIDTSAPPFESVKEAATRFGGMAFWKPISHQNNVSSQQHHGDIVGIAQELERDLIIKERETLDVFKELEATKQTVEQLKLKLQKEATEINEENLQGGKENLVSEHQGDEKTFHPNGVNGLELCPSQASDSTLLELKQAKLNLTRTTTDLADIRAAVDLYKEKIEKQRVALERTHRRLSSNTSKMSCVERQSRGQQPKESDLHDPMNITRELMKLTSETEQFKEVGEAAKSQVLRALSEIQQTRTRIRTAEIRLVAAKKMKEAAKASEAVALAEIKAISNPQSKGSSPPDVVVTLTLEEYSSLIAKAREADKSCNDIDVAPILQDDKDNGLKTEILKKVEEATEEVKSSKKALEEALSRVEAANRGKLAVEEALHVWSSARGRKRRSSRAAFKKSQPSNNPKEYSSTSGLNNPTLSIGQILTRKLLLTEEEYYENRMPMAAKHKVLRKHGTDHLSVFC